MQLLVLVVVAVLGYGKEYKLLTNLRVPIIIMARRIYNARR